ncbi:MAG: hypothetical protein AB1772_12320 [Candidatus Zixiibacteriota bacterium]
MVDSSRDMRLIVSDNEQAVATALSSGSYVLAFLLVHSLIEGLLRFVLRKNDDRVKFSQLIVKFSQLVVKSSQLIKGYEPGSPHPVAHSLLWVAQYIDTLPSVTHVPG